MTRSGFVKTSMAFPSRRFSGQQANETRRPAATLRQRASIFRTEPTGS